MTERATHIPQSLTSRQRRRLIVHLLAIFVVAVVLRWSYLTGYSLDMEYNMSQFHRFQATSPLLFGDGELYFKEARQFALTGSLGLPYRPPMTNIFLALAMKVGSFNYLTAHIWNVILGALVPVLFGLLGTRWFSYRTGVITGWLTTAAFPLIILSGTLTSETLLLVLLPTALLLLERSGPKAMALSGIFMGLAILTRVETALFFLIVLIWQIVIRRDMPLKRRLLVPLCLVLTILPWSIRNSVLLHDQYPQWPIQRKIVPISANGSLNFYLGNGPMASGGYRSFTRSNSGILKNDTIDFNDPIHNAAFFDGYQEVFDYHYVYPGRLLPLMKNKFRFYTRGYRVGLGVTNAPWGLRGPMRRGDIWTTENRTAAIVFLVLWHLGMIATFRCNRRSAFFAVAFITTGLLAAMIYFGLARNAAMSLPFMIMAIACLLDNLICSKLNPLPARSRGVAGRTIAALLALGLVAPAVQLVLQPHTLLTSSKIFSEIDTVGDENYTRQDFIAEYERTLDRLNSEKEVIIYEEGLSKFLVGLAYSINGDDLERVDRIIDEALHVDPANAEAWKLRGVQAMKEPDQLIIAIRALERYIEIDPWASDAQEIGEMISRSKHAF